MEDLLAERGIIVIYETVRRWVNQFGPRIAADLRKRRPKLHTTGHLDELYLKIYGRLVYLWRGVDAEGEAPDVLVQSRRNKHAALKLMRELLKKSGAMPDKIVTDDLRSHGAAALELGISDHRNAGDGATIGRRIRISQPDEGRGKCRVSRAWDPRKDFSQRMPPPTARSTSNAVSFRQEHAGLFERRPQTRDTWPPLLRDHSRQTDHSRASSDKVTTPVGDTGEKPLMVLVESVPRRSSRRRGS
jgi:transposase-like protein